MEKKYPIDILYEDNHIIIFNKKVGQLVQSDKQGVKYSEGDDLSQLPLEFLIKEYIKEKYEKVGNVFLGVAHRIDRPVSGVVVFAKTSKALIRLNEMFQKKEIKKSYWAIVKQKPETNSALLTHFLIRNEKQNRTTAHIKAVPHSKEGQLKYRLLASSDKYHLLEIDLLTGRHHQIRAQLSKIGSPIKGDLKYGAERSNPNGGISLHAHQISFKHPVSGLAINIIAPRPSDDIWQYFSSKSYMPSGGGK